MKIRSLILTAATALFFTACQQDGYKINGTAEGFADGDTIIITTDIESMTPCDTILVKNEHFTFSGPADSVQLALIVGLKQGTSVMFFTEKGTIDVTISVDPFKNHVGGTKANDGWQKITEMSNEYGQRAQKHRERPLGTGRGKASHPLLRKNGLHVCFRLFLSRSAWNF